MLELSVGWREIRCTGDRAVIHRPLSVPSLLNTGSRITWLRSKDTWDAALRPSKIFLIQLQHRFIQTGSKWSR